MSLPADIYFYIVASAAVILVGLAKGGFAGLGAAAMPMQQDVFEKYLDAETLAAAQLVKAAGIRIE